jgi:hypothetical protein
MGWVSLPIKGDIGPDGLTQALICLTETCELINVMGIQDAFLG